MPADVIRPPWPADVVDQLNAYQAAGVIHPFTCRAEHPADRPVLVATADGWECPDPACDFTQGWAHDFMTDPRAAAR